jgi:hypothetical protein
MKKLKNELWFLFIFSLKKKKIEKFPFLTIPLSNSKRPIPTLIFALLLNNNRIILQKKLLNLF